MSSDKAIKKYFKAETEFLNNRLTVAVCVESRCPIMGEEMARNKIEDVSCDYWNIGSYSMHALKIYKISKTTKNKAESGEKIKSWGSAWFI